MKFLKAKIYIEQDEGGTRYTGYPEGWMDNKERIPMISYQSDRSDQGVENGKKFQTAYAIVPDDLYDILMQSDQCSAPTKAEIEAHQNKHEPKTEVITNQTKILTALSKLARKEKLDPTELKAIDPNDSTEAGIEMSKTFLELAESEYATTIQ